MAGRAPEAKASEVKVVAVLPQPFDLVPQVRFGAQGRHNRSQDHALLAARAARAARLHLPHLDPDRHRVDAPEVRVYQLAVDVGHGGDPLLLRVQDPRGPYVEREHRLRLALRRRHGHLHPVDRRELGVALVDDISLRLVERLLPDELDHRVEKLLAVKIHVRGIAHRAQPAAALRPDIAPNLHLLLKSGQEHGLQEQPLREHRDPGAAPPVAQVFGVEGEDLDAEAPLVDGHEGRRAVQLHDVRLRRPVVNGCDSALDPVHFDPGANVAEDALGHPVGRLLILRHLPANLVAVHEHPHDLRAVAGFLKGDVVQQPERPNVREGDRVLHVLDELVEELLHVVDEVGADQVGHGTDLALVHQRRLVRVEADALDVPHTDGWG
mmetsp:Transcript_29929/g.85907  ORF Transcript_29929/g.85907 Transcript_29929/m.85907 type:complete len:381 (+) Transcript_29929:46-1188(+)